MKCKNCGHTVSFIEFEDGGSEWFHFMPKAATGDKLMSDCMNENCTCTRPEPADKKEG